MRVKLKELGEVITGNTPSKMILDYWDSDDISFVKPDIISDSGITTIVESSEYLSEKAREKARIVSENAIFVTCIGSIGKIGIAGPGYYAFNQQINVIVPNENVVPKYLAYAMLHSKPQLTAIANAPVVPIINKSQFSDFEINIDADMQKQVEIVNVLDKVVGIIQARENELSKLDDLVKARFVELFGDFIQRSNKVFLEEISDFVTVGIANSATHAYADSGIVMLRNQNIKENYLDENDLIYITPDFAKKYGSKQLAENDILVIRTGYPGVACLVPKKYKGCQTFTTLIVRLKDVTQAHANYVCYYINSSFGKDYVEQSKVGVAQQNFGAKALAKMPIAVPPVELQKQFAAFVEQTDKSKAAVQKSLNKLQILFDKLMQEYFK